METLDYDFGSKLSITEVENLCRHRTPLRLFCSRDFTYRKSSGILQPLTNYLGHRYLGIDSYEALVITENLPRAYFLQPMNPQKPVGFPRKSKQKHKGYLYKKWNFEILS